MSHQQCSIWADPPIMDGHIIIGTGHFECTGNPSDMPPVTIEVRLRKDRKWWPDKTLASVKQTWGGSSSLTVSYECKGNESLKVFAEIIVDSHGKKRKAQSPRRNFYCFID